MRLALFLLLAVWCFPLPAKPVLYRVLYDDDPLYRSGDLKGLERAYAGKIIILPSVDHPGGLTHVIIDGKAHPFRVGKDRPLAVDGIVFGFDESDHEYVVGADPVHPMPEGQIDPRRNPLYGVLATDKAILRLYPDLGDIGDKWYETLFLQRIAPALAPPPTLLASDFTGELSSQERRAAEAHVDGLPEVPADREGDAYQGAVRLEAIRLRIVSRLGAAILKARDGFHSEGGLPKTTDDWAREYLLYHRDTLPKVREAEKKAESGSQTVEHYLVGLPHIQGRTLERVLSEPQDLIAQKMVAIAKEVRLHLVDGKILANSTFLREYRPDVFLTPGEIRALHGAIGREMIERFPPGLEHLSAAMDVVITPEGRYSIIDLNAGLFSGYFDAYEDLFTTAFLAEYFGGEQAAIVEDWHRLSLLPIGAGRELHIRRMLRTYAEFLKGDVLEAFWDRILADYRRQFARRPSQHLLNEILHELQGAGLKKSTIYAQFLSDVLRRWPRTGLAAADAAYWMERLNRWAPELEFEWKPRHLAMRKRGLPTRAACPYSRLN